LAKLCKEFTSGGVSEEKFVKGVDYYLGGIKSDVGQLEGFLAKMKSAMKGQKR
jgi:hypothetical protein